MLKRTMLAFGVIGLAVLLSRGQGSADEPKADAAKADDDRKSKDPPSRLSQPALAIQLALEGQKRRSPTLMLAAVELLAPLKESTKSLKGVKVELKGEKAEGKGLAVSVAEWVDQAREFAKDDKEMSAFLDKRLDGLTSRGLIYSQGANLPTVTVKGLNFKVLFTGVLNPNQEYVASNAIFEANRPADVFVVADLGARIDLIVQDTTNNRTVGRRVGDAVAVVWDPTVETRARIGVLNAGNFQTKVVVLVAW